MAHGDETALAALEDFGESRLLTCLGGAGGGNDFPGRSLFSLLLIIFTKGYE